jgi:hypothetical protein
MESGPTAGGDRAGAWLVRGTEKAQPLPFDFRSGLTLTNGRVAKQRCATCLLAFAGMSGPARPAPQEGGVAELQPMRDLGSAYRLRASRRSASRKSILT